MKIPRGNYSKCEVIMETLMIPPSIMWLGTKNSSSETAIMITPVMTIIVRMTKRRVLLFFCGFAVLLCIEAVCKSLKLIDPFNYIAGF